MTPALLILASEEEYKNYYVLKYCLCPITTCDNIRIYFSRDKFEHACFESSKRNGVKDTFGHNRAQRLDWIEYVLRNPQASLRKGWNGTNYSDERRVSIIQDDYVVVVKLSLDKQGDLKGNFVTAYLADNSANKIRNAPVWDRAQAITILKGKKNGR